MRKIAALSVMTALTLNATEAHAAISLTAYVAPNFLSGNTTNINSTLAANGWAAYLLVLTSNAAPITTVDFKNDLLGQGGTMGIQMILHQDSKISADDGTTRIATSSADGTLGATATQQGRDSVFLNANYYNVGVPDPFTEDNNKANSANPPYTGSPLTDQPADVANEIAGNDWGVGSLMTFTGAGSAATATKTLFLAYLIGPAGLSGRFRGYAIDANGTASFINSVIPLTPPVYPAEPSSLVGLVFGALCMLKRRPRGQAH